MLLVGAGRPWQGEMPSGDEWCGLQGPEEISVREQDRRVPEIGEKDKYRMKAGAIRESKRLALHPMGISPSTARTASFTFPASQDFCFQKEQGLQALDHAQLSSGEFYDLK